MKSKAAPSMHAGETLRLYVRAMLRHQRQALLILLLPLSSTILGVFVPLFASKLLADIVANGPRLWYDFAWFGGAAVVAFTVNMVGIRACMRVQAAVMRELHDEVFARLLQRSAGFYNNQIGGKLVSDALDFVGAFGQLFVNVVITASGLALTILIGLIVVFVSSWLIGLSIGILLAVLAYWTYRETIRRSDSRTARLKISKKLTSHLSDNIVNAITVKTFAREKEEIAINSQISQQLAQARTADWQHSVTIETERMGLLLLMQAALMFVLVVLTRHNPALLATGIFAFTYTLTLINRFFNINTLVRQIEESFLQASSMTEILQQPIEITDMPDAAEMHVTHGEIVCTDVTFRYADSAQAEHIFHNLNLHIQPGQKIGLVGHSGGGKTTLTRLLLRFDDITSGSITIDGQDIRSVTQASLRQAIAYVPQEPLLFHRTIRENIAYGQPDTAQDAIERAAELASAHEFISKLPDGYGTVVGERGVKLSGGQRQRVAIARAILKDAPILVLDEATSALDSASEKLIQQALWELMDGKTAVVIAHRLSTIQKMDRILVLDNGAIVEDGTHTELLKRKGLYAKLWAHQSGGFIEE